MKIPENMLLVHQMAEEGDDVATGYRDAMLLKFPEISIEDMNAELLLRATAEETKSDSSTDTGKVLEVVLSTLRSTGVANEFLDELLASLSEQKRYQQKLTQAAINISDEPTVAAMCYAMKEMLDAQAMQLHVLQRITTIIIGYVHGGGLARAMDNNDDP